MGEYREVLGNLITLAESNHFDVITHGCNCFSNMKSGIAPQMAYAFGCDEYPMESKESSGDINKLGQIEWRVMTLAGGDDEFSISEFDLVVVNSYTQYIPNVKLKPLDYEALTLCMRKINHTFKGKRIGLPKIGAGLAGGDWEKIKVIIKNELKDCNVTVVIFSYFDK